MDGYSRKVLSWELPVSMDESFCVSALERTLRLYPEPEIFNSNQGNQFTGQIFTSRLIFAVREGPLIIRCHRGKCSRLAKNEEWRLWKFHGLRAGYEPSGGGVGFGMENPRQAWLVGGGLSLDKSKTCRKPRNGCPFGRIHTFDQGIVRFPKRLKPKNIFVPYVTKQRGFFIPIIHILKRDMPIPVPPSALQTHDQFVAR